MTSVDPPAGSTVRIATARKEKTIRTRAEGRAPRATAMRPAMTPAPPMPAAAHNAKVTSGVERCSENHHGGPAAGIGTSITAMLGPAASTAIMMATEMTIRMAAAQARTRLSRSCAGRYRPAVAGAAGGPSAGRAGSPGVLGRSLRVWPLIGARGGRWPRRTHAGGAWICRTGRFAATRHSARHPCPPKIKIATDALRAWPTARTLTKSAGPPGRRRACPPKFTGREAGKAAHGRSRPSVAGNEPVPYTK